MRDARKADREIQNLIQKMITEIHTLHDIKTPISDMRQIIKDLGGTLLETNNCPTVMKTDDEHFRMYIQQGLTKAECNEQIAYLLGHLYLNMGFETSQKAWDEIPINIPQTVTRQFILNRFMTAFLMPERQFLDHLYVTWGLFGRKLNLVPTGKHFHVSYSSVLQRADELGVLETLNPK